MTKPFFTEADFEDIPPMDLLKACAKMTAYRANEIYEKRMREAPDVFVQLKNIDGGLTKEKYYVATQIPNCGETLRAKLVCIEPIEKEDSAEKILKDLCDASPAFKLANDFLDLIERAKALLAKGEK